jgi:hypothetical protein
MNAMTGFRTLGAAFLVAFLGANGCGSSSNSGGGDLDGSVIPVDNDGGITAVGGACMSDKDCAATKQLCDRARSVCVDCLDNSSCQQHETCQKGKCVGFTPCMNSLDCMVGTVCDKDKMRCVECLAAGDCKTGQSCADGTCRASCMSDKDCRAAGQLCATALGYCVGCISDADCTGGFCDMSQCSPQACKPGTKACLGGGAATCSARGDMFGPAVACGANPCVPGVGCGGDNPPGDGAVVLPDAAADTGSGADAGYTQPACNLLNISIVDDMEDGSPLQIPAVGGRTGNWVTFTDGSAGTAALAFPLGTYPQGGTRSLRFYGGGFSIFGAGAELNIHGPATTYYDVKAAGFNGFQFWARAAAPDTAFRVNFPDSHSDPMGGACSTATGCTTSCCYDHFGVDMKLSTDWKLYRIRFEQLYRVNFNGPPATFDPSKVYHVDFRTFFGSFDVYLDDVAFISCD